MSISSIGRDLIGGITRRLGVDGAEPTRAKTETASGTAPAPAARAQVPGWDGRDSFEASRTTATATPEPGGATRPDLAQIQRDFQTADDSVVSWSPKAGGLIPIPFAPEYDVTATEGRMLDGLAASNGLLGLNTFNNIKDQALETSSRLYPTTGTPPGHVPEERVGEWRGQDGHRDAFRHAYWNALMTREFGAEWTQQFATAHEGMPGNPADREAMDLYNNQVGRQIALDNPNASPEELATLVQQAVTDGKMVLFDQRGQLQWSDRVPVNQHGLSNLVPGTGGQPVPGGDVYADPY
ncbi:DUF6973 domain-containing protein [Myxococcus eversor]|uniref:DUF6973 domain-containing protein n=1 Tax=Myxococcus eversor TaxID=2709661 RepID=UPI0013D6A5ED|nr:hypothetical protein [Myxococcus eversor]